MSRIAATLICDVRLQRRNGFYWAVAFLLAVFFVVVRQLPAFDWGPLLPPFLLGNLSMATFFFFAGLVLLERDEGVLEAQLVTPLTAAEYLGSKLLTLTALSAAESLLIVVATRGLDFEPAPLLLGIVAASVLYCLCGFLAVVRYRSINELLFPTMVWITFMSLPILHYAGIWRSPVMYLHPFQASLVLLAGGFRELAAWEWAYGIGYSALAAGALFRLCLGAFERFVVRAAGAS